MTINKNKLRLYPQNNKWYCIGKQTIATNTYKANRDVILAIKVDYERCRGEFASALLVL